jgi:hypothetical protein
VIATVYVPVSGNCNGWLFASTKAVYRLFFAMLALVYVV